MTPWNKMHDEISSIIQSAGGQVVTSDIDLSSVAQWSERANSDWSLDKPGSPPVVLIAIAAGKLNRRDNAKNPFGQDVQFAGEIRTAMTVDGASDFVDRYRGAGGWNPMGEEMCMDVMAIHATKRWKSAFLKHLGTR